MLNDRYPFTDSHLALLHAVNLLCQIATDSVYLLSQVATDLVDLFRKVATNFVDLLCQVTAEFAGLLRQVVTDIAHLLGKKKEVAHVKFYLFDCGIQRALAGLHRDKPSALETGTLFETFILNEFRALNSWRSHGAQFYYWRTESGTEVDLIWKRGRQAVGFEIKSSPVWQAKFNKGLNALLQSGDIQQAFGIYQGERTQKAGQVTALPYPTALRMAAEGGFTKPG